MLFVGRFELIMLLVKLFFLINLKLINGMIHFNLITLSKSEKFNKTLLQFTETHLPVQVGTDPLHIPFGLDPSPPQVTLSSPSSLNPVSQAKVATVPKSCGEVVSVE